MNFAYAKSGEVKEGRVIFREAEVKGARHMGDCRGLSGSEKVLMIYIEETKNHMIRRNGKKVFHTQGLRAEWKAASPWGCRRSCFRVPVLSICVFAIANARKRHLKRGSGRWQYLSAASWEKNYSPAKIFKISLFSHAKTRKNLIHNSVGNTLTGKW